MEKQYQTLHTIYNIVQADPQPTLYRCRPREIILRQLEDWGIIQDHLRELQAAGLVMCEQEDTLVITITAEGIKRVLSFAKNKA